MPSSVEDVRGWPWNPGATSGIVLPQTHLRGPPWLTYTILSTLLTIGSYSSCKHTTDFLQVLSAWLFPLHPTSSSLYVNYLFAIFHLLSSPYSLLQGTDFRWSLLNCKPRAASYSVPPSYSLPYWAQWPGWLHAPKTFVEGGLPKSDLRNGRKELKQVHYSNKSEISLKVKVQLAQNHDKISSCAQRNSSSSWSAFNLVVLKAALICWEGHSFSLCSCEQRRICNLPDIGFATPVSMPAPRTPPQGAQP